MKKRIVSVGVMVVLLVMLIIVAVGNVEQPETGTKSIQVQITYDDVGKVTEVETDAEFLSDWVQEQQGFGWTESEYGIFIEVVDWRVADSEKQEWWCILVDGESATVGVSQIPVEDGKEYTFQLNTGW